MKTLKRQGVCARSESPAAKLQKMEKDFKTKKAHYEKIILKLKDAQALGGAEFDYLRQLYWLFHNQLPELEPKLQSADLQARAKSLADKIRKEISEVY